MNMQAVDSSQIRAVGYDAATRTLAVQFHGKGQAGQPPPAGATYTYSNVPPEIHVGLIGAESVGKFFGANVRGKFDTRKQADQNAAS